ncbi:MAG TPA: hypothetical protein VFR28_06055 [Allosphingosinicella sp.]|nr:hypothetical protein [Allosphingosinicella sp.]
MSRAFAGRLAAVAALLALASPSLAADAAKGDPAKKKICKVEREAVGRLTTKQCKTAAEWEAIRKQEQARSGKLLRDRDRD